MMKVCKRICVLAIILIATMLFTSCGRTKPQTQVTRTTSEATVSQRESEAASASAATTSAEASQQSPDEQSRSVQMTIDGTPVSVNWEENETVASLQKALKNHPLTIQMSMYGGFEQVGSIGYNLPQNDVQTTTAAGDIVLYSGDQIVVFYGSNTWEYTRLGHISDKTAAQLTALLSSGDVTITLTY